MYEDCVYNEETTFKFVVEPFGRKFSRDDTIAVMERYRWMDWKSKVRMADPKYTFWAFEDYGIGTPRGTPFRRVFFGREIALGQRNLIDQYSLKRRKYLGTTSMESEISFFAANMAHVRE